MERKEEREEEEETQTGEGRSKRRKGRKERRLGWLGIARWYRGNSEGEETKREGGRRKGGRRNGTRAQSEEREAFRALLPPSFSFWHGSFCASLFCPSEIYTRVEEMRRREECRDREGERRRFFFVLLDESGAGQARGEGRTGSRVEERQRAKEKARERERG